MQPFSKKREQLRNRCSHSPWIWSLPGWLCKQPISQGVTAFHGLQEERQRSCWLKWRHWNRAFRTLLKKPFCQVLFQRSGNPRKRHFSGTESSLWTWESLHIFIYFCLNRHMTSVYQPSTCWGLLPSKPWKEALVKLWFFIPDRLWPVESSEFWQKNKINWVSSKPFFGFQDPLINLRRKFFSPTEAQEGNDTLWFFTLSCHWSGIFIDQLLTGSVVLLICFSSQITWQDFI